jgi:hypothetical protein
MKFLLFIYRKGGLMEQDNWNDSYKAQVLWDALDKFSKNATFPIECPVCGKKEVHLYYHQWKMFESTV